MLKNEVNPLSLNFAEQIAFFRRKLNIPTDVWDDIVKGAHDRAFVVAGAASAELLDDLRAAVDSAIADGKSLGWFRKQFKEIVAKHGWTGWTGEDTPGGFAWRTNTIYQTNISTSYEAGRYKQLNDNAAVFPWWQYIHADGVQHPRPQHQAWHGIILLATDPWWRTHAPKNGWVCHCSVRGVTRRDMKKLGKTGPDPTPEIVIDPKTGEPLGIDKGWAYQPGSAASTPLAKLVSDKLFKLSAPIGADMAAALGEAIAMEQRLAWTTMVDKIAETMQPSGEAVLAHAITPATLKALAELGTTLETAGIWLRDSDLAHALRDAKDSRGATIPADVWRDLPGYLANAMPYWDTVDPALLYLFEHMGQGGDAAKIVVRVNYSAKLRDSGERKRLVGNFIMTGGVVDGNNLTSDSRYKPLGM